jgi:hypothetical protein
VTISYPVTVHNPSNNGLYYHFPWVFPASPVFVYIFRDCPQLWKLLFILSSFVTPPSSSNNFYTLILRESP